MNTMQPVEITPEGSVTATWLAALVRGFYGALIMFGGTTLTTYLTLANMSFEYQGQNITVPASDRWEMALIVGGVAFFSALGFRGGGEGLIDARRQADGDVKSSDVTPNPPAVVVDTPNA